MGPAERRVSRQPAIASNHLSVSNGRPPDPPPPSSPHADNGRRAGRAPTCKPALATAPHSGYVLPAAIPHGAPLALPCYSAAALSAASQHDYHADGSSAGVILLKSTAAGHSAVSLFDTGAGGMFVGWHFVERHGLQSKLLPSTQKIRYANGALQPARGEIDLPFKVLTAGGKGYACTFRAVVADLQPAFDVVLGTPFCRAHKPQMDWERMTIELPERRRDGSVVWRAALRSSARTGSDDAAGLSLCELSTDQMERLWNAGLLDTESLYCVNIRRTHGETKLNAIGAPTDADSAEEAECARLRERIFAEFAAVFPDKLPAVDVATVGKPKPNGILHRIVLKDGAQPYARPLRRMSTQELDELKKQLQEYLDTGRLQASESPWGTNVIFAKKKDGSLRFCVDYRGLNDLTVRNSYPLPHMDDLFDRLVGARVFSKIDLISGFFQIPLAEEDRAKTAFRTRYGHFEWTVLPMGLTNAPATFQHLMNHSFREFLDRCVLVFLDDIVVYSQSLEQHVADVRAVLQRLKDIGLYAKKSKCALFMPEIEFLGHHVGRAGLRVMQDKVDAVQKWPVPRNASELRSFLGLSGYYRRFVERFSQRAAPLHELTHTADGTVYRWEARHQAAFDELKAALKAAPVLALPDPDRQYVVNTDASDFATGAVLQQDFGRGLQPIAYMSHKMSDAETRYPTHDKEMLAIVNMLGEWRTYLQGRQPFTIRIMTDHNSLQYFMTQPSLSARQSRWLDKLADFDFKIEYIRGPTNVVADALSRRADHIATATATTGTPAGPQFAVKAGTVAAVTLAAFEARESATITKAELHSLPLFAAPTPATLLAAATRAATRRTHGTAATPITPEQRAQQTREATESHPPAADRPSPNRQGVIEMPSQQCVAFTQKGTACRRRTKRGHHCGDHMRLLQRLTVAKSTIAGAGFGLFAAKGKGARPLRAQQRIASYTGDWVQLMPGRRGDRQGGPYYLQLNKSLAVDAARTNTALGRWANAPRDATDVRGRPLRANAELVVDRTSRQGALRAKRDIQPGEEILVSYGGSYWSYRAAADSRPIDLTTSALASLLAQVDAGPSVAGDTEDDLASRLRRSARQDDVYQAVLAETTATASTDASSPITARDGLLYHGDRVVVPDDRELRVQLLSEAHDAGSSGHTGVAATTDRLSRRVYWAGMTSAVHDYVVSCDSCQRNKVEQRRTAGLLRPPPVPEEPGYAINMDFVFGLPRTRRGHTGYLSMTCRLSNWLQIGLCEDRISAEGAAQLVFDRWVLHYGLPAVIISDRDPRFTGRFWRELWRLLDTQLHMSTGGHPQTDGKAENRQRTANTMLRHYVDFEQDDWDMKLLHAAHAINHTKSVSIGLTPFEVMFRRSPRLPLDAALDTVRRAGHDAPPAGTVPAATDFMERHRYLWDAARANLLRAQADQKKYADRHRREEQFAVGDEVLLSTKDLHLVQDPDNRRAAKLTARFVGPFKVTRVINDNAYELELPPQLRIHPVQNISKLRRYRRSPDAFRGRPAPLDRPPPDCVDPAGGEEYHVERILASRRSGRRTEYLIKWQGYPNEDSSWEPRRGLNCPDLLAEFEQRQLLAAALSAEAA